MRRVDVIVLGGGHAGCEAAAAAARRGASVALVTTQPTSIGAMSCNPAIGGIGKGHLVRELDVFDGLMARAADQAAIHYRMLNRSKGPAVWGPRVQADRRLYRIAIQAALESQPGLMIVSGHVDSLRLVGGKIAGVILEDGHLIEAKAVVLAAGTFLGGVLHCGLEQTEGGRVAERAATTLARQLREFALPISRLKTGTPPRLDGRTIDWSRVARQASDREHWTFSPLSDCRPAPQVACAVTYTNAQTHDIIRANLNRSPLFAGIIEGQGPRYCPSIEDKVVKFADRHQHQIFLEPEGLDDPTIYPNGISTSLPADVQSALVRSVVGLEDATIIQPGYAVEYDHVDPRALDETMQLRDYPGLFCAGQINGTTGYEEAAAQGLVAGMNAAASVCDLQPVTFSRSDSYIGVMIDDLTLQGISEPYRMLTARAEYRLGLRADNASTRLGKAALAAGVVGEQRSRWLQEHSVAVERANVGSAHDLRQDVEAEIAADRQYAPYLARQRAEIERLRADADVSLRSVTSYAAIPGLSNEMIERLEAARPPDLAAASRVRGITPAAVSALFLHVRRRAA